MNTRIYRNLNNGRWSIQQKIDGKGAWQVVGHAAAALLHDIEVKQSAAGRDRARRNGKRNVHCSAQGVLVAVTDFQPLKDRPIVCAANTPATQHAGEWQRATYNPFKHETIVIAATLAPITGAKYARFTSTQKMDVIR